MQALIERMGPRIAAAPSPEELVAEPRDVRSLAKREPAPAPKVKPEPIRYTFEGETLTLEEWSARTGIKFHTLNGRLRSGWSVEEALTTSVEEARERSKAAATGGTWARGTPAKRLTHEGETLTLAEWSARTGLKVLTIKNRLRAGRSIAEALDPSDKRRRA
ncbi:hypothetical protein [Paenirhodobacter hankyongi]|uniref:hypothetical protein n=1 Tax=Paenirhodobacter hankyongi TaxID=2294033 RepID=UPI0011C4A959|nr:hypothetical protein [Sinirhodobacter hankyongi]